MKFIVLLLSMFMLTCSAPVMAQAPLEPGCYISNQIVTPLPTKYQFTFDLKCIPDPKKNWNGYTINVKSKMNGTVIRNIEASDWMGDHKVSFTITPKEFERYQVIVDSESY